jgi:anti-sigma B factor antagonist
MVIGSTHALVREHRSAEVFSLRFCVLRPTLVHLRAPARFVQGVRARHRQADTPLSPHRAGNSRIRLNLWDEGSTAMTEQTQPSEPEPPNAFGELEVTVTRDGDRHTVALVGELDIGTVERAEAALSEVESGDARMIVLDLSGLTFMDSTGVRLALAAAARSRADSDRLRFARGGPAVQRVFDLSGVTDTLPFID